MRRRPEAHVHGLAFSEVTAGWIVIRYNPSEDDTDVLAGAFQTVDEAITAAKNILNGELDACEDKLTAQ